MTSFSHRRTDEESPTTSTNIEKSKQVNNVLHAADWLGPNDPGNPHNWPFAQRVFHAAIPAMLGFAVTVGSSIYAPSIPEVASRFNVSGEAAIVPLSVFMVGLGAGPIFASPVSELYGRRIVFFSSMVGFLLFTVGSGLAQNFGTLIVLRFFAGLTGGPVLPVGAGAIADISPPHCRGMVASPYNMSPFLGPAVGPIIGGFTAQYENWRWSQWCMLMMAGRTFLMLPFSKETYKKVILERRAKKHNLENPCHLRLHPSGIWPAFKHFLLFTVGRPVKMLFIEPPVLLFTIYTSFTFSTLFGFFDAYPIVFQDMYGFTVSQEGLAFVAVAVGCILGGLTGVLVDFYFYQPRYKQAAGEGKEVAPEHRLYGAMIGSLGIPIGLFWFAWTARNEVHWICPIIAGLPFGWGNLSIFNAAWLYLLDTYGPLNGASALAANGIMRYALGAGFPLFTTQMYNALGIGTYNDSKLTNDPSYLAQCSDVERDKTGPNLFVGWATSLLGFVSVVLLPIPWVFFRFGPIIRARSHYDTMQA